MSSWFVGVVRGRVAAFAAVAAAAGLALGTAPARAGAQYRAAQALQRPVNFTFGVGPTIPLGNADKALVTGWNALGAVTYHNGALPFGVRASGSYQRFGAKTGRVDPTTTVSGGYGQLVGALLDATLDVPTGVVRPYAIAGVGYYGFRSSRELRLLVGGDGIASVTARRSETAWGVNAGLGLRGGLGALDAFVEARFDNVFTHDRPFGVNQLRAVPVSLGVRF